MKDGALRELTPFIACAMLMGGCFVSEHLSARGEASAKKEILFPEKTETAEMPVLVELKIGDVAMLYMGYQNKQSDVEYEYIKYENIESITYANNDLELTIKLKNSEIYYTGKYDSSIKQYVYEKLDKELEQPKQYVKK